MRLNQKVCVELKDSHTYISSVAGAPAIVLTTPHRQFVFVVSSDAEAHRWAASMKGPNTPEWRWQDPLRRWPKNRIVINDTALMEPIEGSALAFSAQLLRKAHCTNFRIVSFSPVALRSVHWATQFFVWIHFVRQLKVARWRFVWSITTAKKA